jgi:trans-2,3-dihydro-3-hydroxyanthranilate isomerase
MNLSESSFVTKSSIADFGARYWTTAEEIPMAGHPTIATIYTLIQAGLIILDSTHKRVNLELKVGVIPVDVYSTTDGRIEKIVMTQRPPQFLSVHEPSVICKLFNLTADDLLEGVPIQTVSTGTPQLMIALKGKENLRKARIPDAAAYSQYKAQSDFFSPHLFVVNGVSEKAATFARHFGVPPDLMEDPATGSATGGMSAFCAKYGLVATNSFIAEQGHWMSRPSTIYVEVVKGDNGDIQHVKIGGTAVLVLKGSLLL